MAALWDGLSKVPSGIPFTAIIAFVILAIFRDWLVPGGRVKDIRKDRDDRLAEQATTFAERNTEREEHYGQLVADKDSQIEQWRTAYMTSEQSVALLLSQNGELKELARTGVHVLNALPQTAAQGDGESTT